MKRNLIWFCTVVAAALLSFCQAANFSAVAKVTFAAAPADGDTVTINGALRTFRTSVSSAATEVAIGATTNLTAANYAAQLSLYPYTDLSAHLSAGTVYLMGKINLAISTASTGSWGSISVTNVALTNYTLILPLSAYPPGQRAFIGNLLVDAISTYPTNAINGTAPSMANFFSLGQPNLATGANTFSGPGTFSNSNTFNGSVYLNGSNYVQLSLKITNDTPGIEFHQSDGAVNKRRSRLMIDQNGLTLTFLNDAGSSSSNIFSIDRDATFGALEAIFRTRLTADSIYNTLITNSSSTNGIFLHTANALIANLMMTGNASASNTAPTFTLHDTDAASGSQKFLLKADANVLHLAFADDAGAIPLSPRGDVFTVSRAHGADATVETLNFYPLVQFNGGMSVLTGDIYAGVGLLRTANGVIVGGSAGSTLPSGAAATLLLASGSGPAVVPSGYSIFWSSGGEAFFRNGVTGEGDSADNRIYNRKDSVFGAGTDYSLTTSTAFVDFGVTDPKITLPTSGTYWIWAKVGITEDGSNANDEIRAKLRNETSSTDLTGGDDSVNSLPAGKVGTITLLGTVTGNASDVISIWAHNNSGSARGTVNSARTRIGYVRLY